MAKDSLWKSFSLLLMLVAVCLSCVPVTAQTQQGCVKTVGRQVNGKIVPGKNVAGVTIRIKDRSAVVSRDNGTFSFLIPDKKYMLLQVQKKGYVLTDPDLLTRQYNYSANPLVILMADQEEQASYRRYVEKTVRDKLYADLERQVAEMKAQLEQHKITEEKYHELLQKVNNDYNDNERIVKDMAEQYTKIDFDALDEFNRRVSDCIIGGRLTEADSLLSTKGDINLRAAELSRHYEANEAEHQKLERSRALELANRDDLAKDCYTKYTIFLMRHQFDSAAHYIELRASLVPLNAEWISDAGTFLFKYLSDYAGAEQYFRRSKELHQAMGDEALLDLSDDDLNIAETYYVRRQKEKAAMLCREALDIRRQLLGENHVLTADAYNDLGLLKDDSLVLKAIRIVESLPGDTLVELAQYYENYAGLRLIPSLQYRQAMRQYLLPALRICRRHFGEDHLRTGDSYKSIGDLYYRQANSVMSKWWIDCARALDAYLHALDIYEKNYGTSHLRVAELHYNIGRTLQTLANGSAISDKYDAAYGYNKLAEAELEKAIGGYQDYEKKFGIEHEMMQSVQSTLSQLQENMDALESEYGKLMQENPRERMALCYYDQGMNYNTCKHFDRALCSFDSSMAIFTGLFGESFYFLPEIYYQKGCACYYQGDTCKNRQYFEKAVQLMLNQGDSNMVGGAHGVYAQMGSFYDNNEAYDWALDYYNQALAYDAVDYDRYEIFWSIADVLEHQGRYEQALDYCDSVIDEEDCIFLPDFEFRICSKVGRLFSLAGKPEKAISVYEQAISLVYDTLQKAELYDCIGRVYADCGKYGKARKNLRQAQKIRMHVDYSSTADSLLAQAESEFAYSEYYLCRKDSVQAVKHLMNAYEIYSRNSGRQSIVVAECIEMMGKICETFGDIDKAIQCYIEAGDIKAIQYGEFHREVRILDRRVDQLIEQLKK